MYYPLPTACHAWTRSDKPTTLAASMAIGRLNDGGMVNRPSLLKNSPDSILYCTSERGRARPGCEPALGGQPR